MPPDPDEERAALRAEAGPRATTPHGAPFPLRSWPPDAAVDIQHLAEWADTYTFAVFVNAAARDAAIPAPVEGQMCYLIDLKQYQTRIGTIWTPTGGVMPWATMSFAQGSIAANWVNQNPAPISSSNGGATWGSWNQGIPVPYKGHWLITWMATLNSSNQTIAANNKHGLSIAINGSIANTTALEASFLAGLQYSSMFWSRTLFLNAGDRITGATYSTYTTTIGSNELMLQYLAAR